ncbi:peptide MFS transporter [Rickettsia endosymbiont of Cardiosporidium cionae]|uniref:peptide MFS transporter n=1 Tax=Rickettsia endosymbiont of Cardiosporidium cionae TaxID=2777155 RepID=UPI0018935CAF|nr:oligopeptide:H+ symporter [Rickettsia endosymbiont of Cardiosporidium cionae]KAF8818863.1 Dipeptide and tripeptide permease C [Rickettsia endosymbiont of Cardiosporidium cionae]
MKKSYPNFLLVLFSVEVWERFSYYGIRSILVLFLISELNLSDKEAISTYSLFSAISFIGPVLGGWIADNYFGYLKMVTVGGIVLSLGHMLIFCTKLHAQFLYLGLATVAIGCGFFKGNINNLLGICYSNDQYSDQDRFNGFNLFYAGINIGAVLSTFACSYIGKIFGLHYGLSIAGVGMLIGLYTLYKHSNIFKNQATILKKKNVNNIFFISTIILIFLLTILLKNSYKLVNYTNFAIVIPILILIAISYLLYLIKDIQDKKNALTLFIFFIFMMIFFAFEMQLGSLICLFIERNVNTKLFGFSIPSPVIATGFNSFVMVVFAFLLSRESKTGFRTKLFKFSFGILSVSICFATLYYGCLVSNNGYVNPMYVLLALFFIAIGEVIVTPFVQAQSSLIAPIKFKGIFMGMSMLAIGIANFSGFIFAKTFSIQTNSIDSLMPLDSIMVYQQGFLYIAKINLIFFTIFLTLIPFILMMSKKTNLCQ